MTERISAIGAAPEGSAGRRDVCPHGGAGQNSSAAAAEPRLTAAYSPAGETPQPTGDQSQWSHTE